MFRKLVVLVGILAFALVMFMLLIPTPKQQKSGLPSIVTSNFALYDIVRYVASSSVEASMLLPFSQDIHSFRPTPKDIARLQDSLIFFYSGAELEPWSSSLDLSSNAYDISRGLNLIEVDDGHNHGAGHSHNSIDPHYWLDMDNMIILVDKIVATLVQRVDGIDVDLVTQKATEYKQRLLRVDALYKKRLKSCAIDTILVDHNAFGYLAHRYGFKVESISGISSESMPSAKSVANVLNLAEQKGIRVIFYDALGNDNSIAALTKQSHLHSKKLFTIANVTAEYKGADYLFFANQNLQLLRVALECR